jgi:hypothetical protein
MSESLTKCEAAAHAGLTAAALSIGRLFAWWSLALFLIAMLVLWFSMPPMPTRLCVAASILAGIVQAIFALRVALDAALFRQWQQSWAHASSNESDVASYQADMVALDRALVARGWIADSTGDVRSLGNRSQGALQLLRKQAVALIFQAVLMLVATAMHFGY